MTSRASARLPLLVAAVYVAFLVWQAPHTVHHFFEPEVEQPNECALGAAAERSAGTTVDAVTLAPVAAIERSAASGAMAVAPRPTPSVHGARAPPLPAA